MKLSPIRSLEHYTGAMPSARALALRAEPKVSALSGFDRYRNSHPFGGHEWDSIIVAGEPLWFLKPVVCDCVGGNRGA